MKYNFLQKAVLCVLYSIALPHIISAQTSPDSITIAVGPQYDHVSGMHRLFFGENYRKLWAISVKLRVLHLQTEKGGMVITERGGGLQTKSLRLKDASGREWVIRSVQKYPERALPPNLRKTVAKAIIQDQISTSIPFAALTVPPMAGALQILHTNPEIIYIADDAGLGIYQQEFANNVYLFEEREPLTSTDTDNTEKVFEKRMADNDVIIDEKMVLRARLLDMILGDWDRHEDQWRWDKQKADDRIIYTPVPRDRDQVYYKTSGIIPFFVYRRWLLVKYQPYQRKIKAVSRWNYNARNFDRYFLSSLNEADWKVQIDYVQAQLTDDVVIGAMKKMPDNVFRLSGQQLAQTLIARRNNMGKQAMEYYRSLTAIVSLPASDKKEYFDISETDNGQLRITIRKIKKDDSLGHTMYERLFEPGSTKEVRLYGMGGPDVFHVSGMGKSNITVRMIGGSGNDSFAIDQQLNNKRRLYVYDRKDEANRLPLRSQAKLRTSNDSAVHAYNPKGFVYNNFTYPVSATFNNDYGLTLTAAATYTAQGFRKTPFAYRHHLGVNYSLPRRAVFIDYLGEFKQIAGKTDLGVQVVSRGPNFIGNFFGIGNETEFSHKEDGRIAFHQNRYDYVTATVRLEHTYGKFRVNAGVAAQYYNSASTNNADKFLRLYNQKHPDAQVFATKLYAGPVAGFVLDTRNNDNMPTAGVYVQTSLAAMQQINKSGTLQTKYSQAFSEVSFYLSPGKHSDITLANRTGGGVSGGHPAFFQQYRLGGPQNLRGFRTLRFTGESMLYNNLELRLKLFDFNSYFFPGSVGITGFNDVGRVWSPGEKSTTWHTGYGGGLYVIPAELLVIQLAAGFSKEGTYPYFSVGYRF